MRFKNVGGTSGNHPQTAGAKMRPQKDFSANLRAPYLKTKAISYETQEELFFACTSLLILLVLATADVLARGTW